MILFISSSSREAAALTTTCEHRTWTSYSCATVREFHTLKERIQPRAVVVRHRLIDGYSDDVLAIIKTSPLQIRPRVIVLMSADRTARAEARQIALGADSVLHDPVRVEILLEYLAKYRMRAESKSDSPDTPRASYSFAGAEIHPHERRITLDKKILRIAPQEVALLNILSNSPNRVVPYPVLYGDLFARRFEGDTANCRVLLGKLSASFKGLGIELKPFIQVIPKSGYLYISAPPKIARKSPTPAHGANKNQSLQPGSTAKSRPANR